MISKKRIIIPALIIILIGGLGLSFVIQFTSPRNVIERTFGVDLPADARIVNFTNEKDLCEAKLLISDSDIQTITDSLGDYGLHENSMAGIMGSGLSSWWDLDTDNVEYFYVKFSTVWRLFYRTQGESAVYITNSSDGKRYVYLQYTV